MKRFFLIPIVWVLIPSLGLAYTVVLNDGTTIKEDRPAEPEEMVQINYGPTTLQNFNDGIERIELKAPEAPKPEGLAIFESVAEAAGESAAVVINSYFRANKRIGSAFNLKDIESVVSEQYYRMLSDKIEGGADEIVVLQLVQNMRPDRIEVLDSRVLDDYAEIAVSGNTMLGPLFGVVEMKKTGDSWRLAEETWMRGDNTDLKNLHRLNEIYLPEDPVDIAVKDENMVKALNAPDFFHRRKPLTLSSADVTLSDTAFTFFFFVDKGQKPKKKIEEDPYRPIEKRHAFHVVWTGPEEIVSKQKVMRTRYPLDVSIAEDGEGYLPGKLNVQLPDDQPNGVIGAFLLKF